MFDMNTPVVHGEEAALSIGDVDVQPAHAQADERATCGRSHELQWRATQGEHLHAAALILGDYQPRGDAFSHDVRLLAEDIDAARGGELSGGGAM